MNPREAGPVVSSDAVLASERQYLVTRRTLAGLGTPARSDADALRPIGIALSGGGIRSATFNLGILQALSSLGILPRIDYLSTVSGGGYIGSCLTSLLSHRRQPDGAIAVGDDAYAIDPKSQTPYFGTVPATFPFNAQEDQQPDAMRFKGSAQVRHLRTHGDFIITRKQVFSRDMLRAVGNVLGGLFYHLLMFVLFLAGASSIYFAIVLAMVGDVRELVSPLLFSDYVARLVDWPGFAGLGGYPLFWAFVAGVLVALAGLLITGVAMRILPDRWFIVDGRSGEDQREICSLWVHVVLTALTAIAVTWWFVAGAQPRLVFLMLPLGVYLGGEAAALVLHAVVAMSSTATRNDRSRFAAVKGILNYLAAASFVVVLLPWLIYWLAEPQRGFATGGGWLLSVAGAWLLSRWGGSDDPSPATGRIRRLLGLSSLVRNALLSALVVFVLIGGVVLVSSAIVQLQPDAGVPLMSLSLAIGLSALALFCLLGFVLDFNELSLHYFYRDRLVETYLQTYAPEAGRERSGPELPLRDDAEMPLTHVQGCRLDPAGAPLPDCVTAAPLHLLVASLNLTASRDMTRRDRKSDHFIFSKLFCGSDTTGYMPTAKYRGGQTRLARAMTISGAAASSAMGRQTFFAQAFALTLFNGRLGQWMENPRHRGGARTHWNERAVFWPFYLLREVLGSTDANRRLVHLSDGGHTGDNLGIVPLLKRRCAVVIACDAEADPTYAFGSLTGALRQIYIDENIKVDLEIGALRPDPATGRSGRHFAVGAIRYPKKGKLPEATGWLLVLKSSLVGDELARIGNYKQENPDFPQQSTADQFFDDDQFESYRELGYHVAKSSLIKVSDRAWQPDLGRDWEACWEELLKA